MVEIAAEALLSRVATSGSHRMGSSGLLLWVEWSGAQLGVLPFHKVSVRSEAMKLHSALEICSALQIRMKWSWQTLDI